YYSDSDLRAQYRFGREAILNIVRLIEEEIRPATNRSFPISATNQVLITLRFLATGSFLQVTGDTIAGADKSTVSRIVRRVTLAIARKLDDFVKFPGTQHEKALIKQGFYDLGGFPCVIGCVDGSHIRIIVPSANECNFVNRKGYHSINIQGICDHKEGTTLDDGVLLGDSGYPCLPYLMTPYNNPITVQQRRFNRAQKCTRSSIERAFGILKRRFHLLHSEIRMAPDRVCTLVAACCVLHNIAIDYNEPMGYHDEDEDQVDLGNNYQGANRGDAVRSHITNTYF
ncbi:Hypothetical predicted protein, partial [Paramuricea clavata]